MPSRVQGREIKEGPALIDAALGTSNLRVAVAMKREEIGCVQRVKDFSARLSGGDKVHEIIDGPATNAPATRLAVRRDDAARPSLGSGAPSRRRRSETPTLLR